MGRCLYLHRSALDAVPGLSERAAQAGITEFDVVKVNEDTGSLSFIRSSDFDTANEPTVESSILLKRDGTQHKVALPQADPWIYHHKWLFVADAYPGFDVEASKQRSRNWLALEGVDTSRIGKRSFWEVKVVPRIG
jgi:hypothetical protein